MKRILFLSAIFLGVILLFLAVFFLFQNKTENVDVTQKITETKAYYDKPDDLKLVQQYIIDKGEETTIVKQHLATVQRNGFRIVKTKIWVGEHSANAILYSIIKDDNSYAWDTSFLDPMPKEFSDKLSEQEIRDIYSFSGGIDEH